MYTRDKTIAVKVGNLIIGGNNDVIIQSMTTTKTSDVKATVDQIKRLEKMGCQIVRVACLDEDDARAIKEIKAQINIPLVADIHFNYKLALLAVEAGIDKIRINPGNIGSEDKTRAVVEACQKANIPIRIGINGGSLEQDILDKYNCKVTAEAMVESAQRHVDILEKLGFYNTIISLKASDVLLAVAAYQLAAKTFKYPLHLGITEAGTGFGGTIKSSAGMAILLNQGIGSTIRISLSEDPCEEIKVCKELLKCLGLKRNIPNLISCPTCGRIQFDLIPVAKEIEQFLAQFEVDIDVAVMGCAVNGPGEARHCDIGVAGGGKNALLFRKGEVIRTITHKEMIPALKEEILQIVEEKRQKLKQ